ncbi:MAG: hypothetical protein KKF68_03590 [Nanoarchaeota archaeon]|nr:hypothetical protein [Nanoarchaeota archaeon]
MTGKNQSQKIAVSRGFRLEDIEEVVGYNVSEKDIKYFGREFHPDEFNGCHTLVFVGASKVDAGSSCMTVHVPFSEIATKAKTLGVTNVYRVYHRDGLPSGKNFRRSSKGYVIEKITD